MKKLALIAAVFAATATMTLAGIDGTGHDFADGASAANQFGTEICKPCHTPHNAVSTTAPLWSHVTTDPTTAGGGYTLYSSSTMSANNQTVTAADIDSYTKMCMSCHDGSVNLDAHVGGPNSGAGTKKMTGTALIGTDLSDDHPIGVSIYSDGLTTGGTTLLSGYKAPNGTTAKVFADSGNTGVITCASCHNAHDNTNGSFLRASNANSAICLQCHDK